MLESVRKIARKLLAAGICFAFTAHCGNVSINKRIATADIPGVGCKTKLS